MKTYNELWLSYQKAYRAQLSSTSAAAEDRASRKMDRIANECELRFGKIPQKV